MLMTEKYSIVRRLMLLEEKTKEQGLENNEKLVAVEDELEDIPDGFLSQLEKAVEEDIEKMEEQPVGDEAVGMMIAAAILSGPMIMKGIKYMAKKMAQGLKELGINEAGEDVWWTGLPMDDEDCWYHKWHHFYEATSEKIGTLILKLFGNSNPSDKQIKAAGACVFLTACTVMGVMSFGGLMGAIKSHEMWKVCGETLLTCIEYGEVMMLLNTICAVAMGVEINAHAEEHGIVASNSDVLKSIIAGDPNVAREATADE